MQLLLPVLNVSTIHIESLVKSYDFLTFSRIKIEHLMLLLQAFAEWVLYTSSGISSGLYHACDVGTWCALSFHVLQVQFFFSLSSSFVLFEEVDFVYWFIYSVHGFLAFIHGCGKHFCILG